MASEAKAMIRVVRPPFDWLPAPPGLPVPAVVGTWSWPSQSLVALDTRC